MYDPAIPRHPSSDAGEAMTPFRYSHHRNESGASVPSMSPAYTAPSPVSRSSPYGFREMGATLPPISPQAQAPTSHPVGLQHPYYSDYGQIPPPTRPSTSSATASTSATPFGEQPPVSSGNIPRAPRRREAPRITDLVNDPSPSQTRRCLSGQDSSHVVAREETARYRPARSSPRESSRSSPDAEWRERGERASRRHDASNARSQGQGRTRRSGKIQEILREE